MQSTDKGNIFLGYVTVLENIQMARGALSVTGLLFCNNQISPGLKDSILHFF